LIVHVRSKEKGKKRENGRSKSHGKQKSLGNYKEKCWNYDNIGHFIRDYEEEKTNNKKENNGYDDESKKYSQEDGGDAFVVALTPHRFRNLLPCYFPLTLVFSV
jgi:hypothetical protein